MPNEDDNGTNKLADGRLETSVFGQTAIISEVGFIARALFHNNLRW